MRTHKIEDDKLKTILEKRAALHKELIDINERIMDLDKLRESAGLKMERLKEKTSIIVDKFKEDFNLQEFDVITRVYMEDGKCFAEIADVVEEYKQHIRDKKNEDNSNNGDN